MKYLPLDFLTSPVIAIINPTGDSYHLVRRIKQFDPAISVTVHDSTGDIPDKSLVIAITQQGDLPDWWHEIKGDAVLLSQKEADGLTDAQQSLQISDWQILRELERKFLSDHPLHAEREQWRKQVDEEIKADTDPDEQ